MGLLRKASKAKERGNSGKKKSRSVKQQNKVTVENTRWINKRLETLAKRVSTDLNTKNANTFLKIAWRQVSENTLHPLDVERVKRITVVLLRAHKNNKIQISPDVLEKIRKLTRSPKT